MKRRSVLSSFCLVAVAVVIAACGGTATNSVVPRPQVRCVNASPNSTSLSFLLDDTALGTGVAYLGSTAGFADVDPGDRDAVVVEAGTPESEVRIAQVFENDRDYLMVAYGLVTPPNDELDKRMELAIIDVNRNAQSDTQARLVVLNAYNRAVGLQNPPIDFKNPGDQPAVSVEGLAFGEFSATIVDAGSQTFVAKFAGEEGEVTPPATFTFVGGKTYLGIVTGQEGDALHPPTISFIQI